MPDPYIGDDGVLLNKLGINDARELASMEADIVAVEEAILLNQSPDRPFDLSFLLGIHRTLFGDIYAWAGKPRTTTLAKQMFEGSRDRTVFMEPVRIRIETSRLLAALPEVESLRDMPHEEFNRTLANCMVMLNNIHPFREGNGRTQRLFFKLLARASGHDLVWDVVTRERMVSVSVLGAQHDPEPMVRLFQEISCSRRVEALEKGLDFLRSESSYWNDLYIATTTKGQSYSGKLVGIAAPDFMMRVEEEKRTWVAIGDMEDVPESTSSGDDMNISPKHW